MSVNQWIHFFWASQPAKWLILLSECDALGLIRFQKLKVFIPIQVSWRAEPEVSHLSWRKSLVSMLHRACAVCFQEVFFGFMRHWATFIYEWGPASQAVSTYLSTLFWTQKYVLHLYWKYLFRSSLSVYCIGLKPCVSTAARLCLCKFFLPVSSSIIMPCCPIRPSSKELGLHVPLWVYRRCRLVDH